jgi:hypothetical protein
MEFEISILDRIFNKLGYTHKKFDYTPKDRLQALLEQFIPLQLPLTRVGAEADGGYLIPIKLLIVVSFFDTGGLSSNDTQLFEERERVFAEMWEMRFRRAIIALYRFICNTLLHLPKPRLN